MKQLIDSLRGHAVQGRYWQPPPPSQFLIWAEEIEEQCEGEVPPILLYLLHLSDLRDVLPEWKALLEKAKRSRYRTEP